MSPAFGCPPSALVEKNASAVTGTVKATRINKYNPATTQAHRFIHFIVLGGPTSAHQYCNSHEPAKSFKLSLVIPAARIERTYWDTAANIARAGRERGHSCPQQHPNRVWRLTQPEYRHAFGTCCGQECQ